jgi:hypothetical protein
VVCLFPLPMRGIVKGCGARSCRQEIGGERDSLSLLILRYVGRNMKSLNSLIQRSIVKL